MEEIKTGKLEANLKIHGTGTVQLEWNESVVTLEDCAYSPEIFVNLISPGQLTKRGCSLTQHQNRFSISRNGLTVLKGLIGDNLFVIEKPQSIVQENKIYHLNQHSNLETEEKHSLMDLHRIYVHASISMLKPILRNLFSKEELNNFQCNGCIKSKIKQSPFSATSTQWSKPLKHIHLDVIGPITPQSNSGNQYILTLVDNFTGHLADFPLTSKEETPETIINILQVEFKN